MAPAGEGDGRGRGGSGLITEVHACAPHLRPRSWDIWLAQDPRAAAAHDRGEAPSRWYRDPAADRRRARLVLHARRRRRPAAAPRAPRLAGAADHGRTRAIPGAAGQSVVAA